MVQVNDTNGSDSFNVVSWLFLSATALRFNVKSFVMPIKLI